MSCFVSVRRGAANRSIRHAVTCMLALMATGAHAQVASEEDELSLVFGDKSTISIATGSQQPLRRAPAVATVITAEDIAAMGATDLDEVLETVPGIHVSRNVQGYNPLYVFRGIYSEFNAQTLMLQNGVPMTMMFIGNRGNAWAGLPLENVARIEVIRGPGSALYGADAYSGVINIITKSAADVSGTEFGVRAGSFRTADAWGLHGGKVGPFDVAGYVRVGSTEGFTGRVDADAQTLNDTAASTHVSHAPGSVNLGHGAVDGSIDLAYDKIRLRAGYRLRDRIGLGGGAASALDPVGRGKTERYNADLSWNDIELSANWKLGLTASYFEYITTYPQPLQVYPPGAVILGPSPVLFPDGMLGAPNTWERQQRISAVASYSGWSGHRMRFGVGQDDLNMYRTQEFKNFAFGPSGLELTNMAEVPVADSFLAPRRRIVRYVYAQDEWNFARDWALTAGVRHDRYSDFGGTTNPRAALVWDASLDLTAKVLYGRAFRAPAFTEQYSVNNPVLRGNPDLKPEIISTMEAAFSWQAASDTQLQLNLFRYDMKDIIRTAGAPATWSNTGAQRGRGLELEATHDLRGNVRLVGNYAYQRSTDDASGKDAGYAPHHHLFARADWGFASGLLFSGQVNHVADRERPPGDVRPKVPDYTTVDLTVRTRRGKSGWDVAASVRNLFNAEAREPSLYSPGNPNPVLIPNDLPLAGRSVYLQLTYRL
ncbi:MAG TPA: TonB-dependent receptor [Aquabacterium sp.]|uniref:TonB-dependent receptor plug domain-containing protein n=1 Tax=Aquabacterium sp. TaxID=1872578 RepID=UPI002E303945|nr:TonB-dependent receptor [Aquabacterium sp.]HEX5355873.1 TonB-dependent receptor [Aquabacterium sp.]